MNVFESQPKLFKALSSAAVFSEAKSYIENKTGFFLELNNPSAQSMFIGALFHALNQSVFVVQENEGGAEESHENLSDLIDDRAFILPNCEEDTSLTFLALFFHRAPFFLIPCLRCSLIRLVCSCRL